MQIEVPRRDLPLFEETEFLDKLKANRLTPVTANWWSQMENQIQQFHVSKRSKRNWEMNEHYATGNCGNSQKRKSEVKVPDVEVALNKNLSIITG
jgi:hypothetical protein